MTPSGAGKWERLAWSCFDIGSSSFTTVIVDLVFAVYFVRVICAHRIDATWLWTLALFASQAFVALSSPWIGAMADVLGCKKRMLFSAYAVCILSSLSLARMGEGDVWPSLITFAVTNISFSFADNLMAGFLPEITTFDSLGALSGWARSLGNLGSLANLLLVSPLLASGFTVSNAGRIQTALALTTLIYGLAGLPALLLLRERTEAVAGDLGQALRQATRRLGDSVPDVVRPGALRTFFASSLLCGAGATIVMVVVAIYAQMAIGMADTEQDLVLLAVQGGACVGAFLLGKVKDWIGSARTLQLVVLVWVVSSVALVCVQSKPLFWATAFLVGIGNGSLFAVSRAVMGLLSPATARAQYYGLWFVTGRVAAAVGPLLFGVLFQATHSFRLPMTIPLVCFALGFLILLALPSDRTQPAVARPPAMP
ncbi:MFS transporter [Methylacidimicrobium sp. B4]|uniref:MFS transporter n=1 Tax=Methylacidimicrobium sp. B4 TaxID=2796139 RepID=UPI001A8EE876|nr:MFS transporter [Methylacidimicrobium sp. B4]QSR83827.1 MFS transporter [Methylacidimicrobium sp. B4]